MTVFRDVAIRHRLEDIVKARDQIALLVTTGFQDLEKAKELTQQFARYAFPYEATGRMSQAQVQQALDAGFWRNYLKETGLVSLFDDKARKEFEQSLEKDPPPFTMKNVESQVLALYQLKDEIFARGIYTIFRRLANYPGGYQTNKRIKFAMPAKFITSYDTEPSWGLSSNGGLRIAYRSQAWVNDLDRVLCVLSGKTYDEYSLEKAINTAWAEPPCVYEDNVIKAKGFKKGTIHWQIKDEKVLDRINQTIAAYCDGRAIPEVKEAA